LHKSLVAFSPANVVAAFVAFPGIGASVNIPVTRLLLWCHCINIATCTISKTSY
jgi:hypothetical protein